MEEVNNLLREAWEKAYERGIILRSVSFGATETYGGNLKLHDVDFDAKLKESNQNE